MGVLLLCGLAGLPSCSASRGDWCAAATDAEAVMVRDRDPLWSRRFGGATVSAAVFDSGGNVLATGWFGGTIDFGDGPHSNVDRGRDAFVVKLDGDGKTVFSRSFKGDLYGLALAADARGNIALVGRMNGEVDFGTGALRAPGKGTGAFVVKLDAAGTTQWAKVFATSGSSSAGDVAVDDAGSIHAVITPPAGGVSLVKLDSAGGHVWTVDVGGKDREGGGSPKVATGARGRVAVLWERYHAERVALGGASDPPTQIGEQRSVHVALLDDAGRRLWRHALDGSHGGDVMIDARGDVVVVGVIHAMDRDTFPQAFAAKIAADGRASWSEHLAPELIPHAVAADSGGHIMVVGTGVEGLDACGRRLGAGQGAYAVRLAATGTLAWAQKLEAGPIDLSADAVDVDATGAMLVAGFGEVPPRHACAPHSREHALAHFDGDGSVQQCQEIRLGNDLDAFIAKYAP